MKVSKFDSTMLKLARMTAENIAKKEKIEKTEAFTKFMKSKTGELLFDDKTLMWHNGPDYLEYEYYRELKGALSRRC